MALAPVLAACTSDDGGSTAAPTRSATASAAPDARATAADTERALLALASKVQARWPATASAVVPVQAAHTAHVVALVGATPSATAEAGPSDAPLVAGTAGEALRRLAAAERSAASQHSKGALGLDGEGARLLASIASYAAAQDVVLTRASTTTGVGR